MKRHIAALLALSLIACAPLQAAPANPDASLIRAMQRVAKASPGQMSLHDKISAVAIAGRCAETRDGRRKISAILTSLLLQLREQK